MTILFDARMMGEGYGIGVYIRQLLARLVLSGKQHHWLILVSPNAEQQAKDNFNRQNVKVVVTNIPHYSLAEQTRLPKLIKSFKPDLVHFPNFNVPIFYGGNYVVTIHDLVHHKLPGHRRSRWHKRLAYKLIISRAVGKSKGVITVSQASKQDLIRFYPGVDRNKIFVIPEGVNDDFNAQELPGETYRLREKYKITQPYLLFVGVWEVKKNLPFLARMFAQLADKYADLQLVLAGKTDPWHPEVRNEIMAAAGVHAQRVVAPGFVEPEDLPALYRQAALFINPSPYEGFGLPGLEAMSCGKPVLAADTPVFKEIYADGAVYFDPYNLNLAVKVLDSVLSDRGLQESLSRQAMAQARKYRWEQAAGSTLQLYERFVKF